MLYSGTLPKNSIHLSIHYSIQAMAVHADAVIRALSVGPRTSRQLSEQLGVSQPTVSRVLSALGPEVLRVGAGKSIQYALRDRARALEDIPIYRVSAEGTLRGLGKLISVHPGPDAFVFIQSDGATSFFDGLPWWLDDMRPQGFLGRAYAARHGRSLGFPDDCRLWSGSQTLRSLLAHGHDGIGNLLLGDYARDLFLAMQEPMPVDPREFPEWAAMASSGDTPGSSAGGEQPKFVSYTRLPHGPRHTIVKFAGTGNEVGQRWADLLLAEHLALDTLRDQGQPAAPTFLVDTDEQRFLVAERFDRIGVRGRIAMISLEVLDAEFVGLGKAPWPVISRSLAQDRRITMESLPQIQALWAFGVLIGNTDMHLGNLAFLSEHGQPYQVAPAYDMSPMAFAPTRSGQLPARVQSPNLHASVPVDVWRTAWNMAQDFLGRMRGDVRFSPGFTVCVNALENHLDEAAKMLERQE